MSARCAPGSSALRPRFDVVLLPFSPRVTVLARRIDLPASVWLLGWVSFFTDTASEMIYPLMPLFLTRVLGAGAMSIGVIEGVAEAVNSVLKIWSGRLADKTDAPRRLVIAGYGLSSAMRPFIGAATSWTQVLGLRFLDRLGKGIRGAPRDAMLAVFASASNRGRVFGFHRAMDHAGAVIGPLIASAFLFVYPDAYRPLFAVTIIPGIIAMLILFRVPEAAPRYASTRNPPRQDFGEANAVRQPASARNKGDGGSASLAALPGGFYRAVAVILIFSFGNASDAFLLLRMGDLGVAAFWIPLLWSAIHVVKSASSVIGGTLSDRFGRPTLIALGWLVYALVYGAFGAFENTAVVVIAFLTYGLYFGLTEGVEKAWVADLSPANVRGTAFGIYNAVLGCGSLAASLLFGAIWTRVSPPAAFYTGAALAAAATMLLYFLFSPDSTAGTSGSS
jgi:MFS family permease